MEKKMELLQVDENGQMFVDWDSLEAITNEKFVSSIQAFFGQSHKNIDVLEIRDSRFCVQLFFKDEEVLGRYEFHKDSKSYYVEFYNKYDVARMVRLIQQCTDCDGVL